MALAFEDLAPVRTFVNGIEAEIARSALEAAGIRAVVRRDDCGGVRPSLWLAGIDVLVPRDRLAAAADVLDTPALYAAAIDDTPPHEPSVFDFSARTIAGNDLSLDTFRGRVLLVVNVASRCGYTGQYAQLEQIYRRFRHRGFAVLGFPCNQFGRQEPGTEPEIQAFCSRTYDITFPLFAKVDVNGPDAHPLFAFLKAEQGGWFGSAIRWNFTKFLVDRTGRVLERYGPPVPPVRIVPAIEQALADPAERLHAAAAGD